jgi:PAS domain S-box-containing protein
MCHATSSILIVEDSTAHAELLLRSLKSGWPEATLTFCDSLEGYRNAVATQLPDIALIDMRLPDGSALDILATPAEDGLFPVVVMTSSGSERMAVDAMKAGALDYVVKSVEAFAEMPHTLQRALREWELRRGHRKAQDALRESEAKFRSLLQYSSDPIFCLNPDGTYRFVNDAFALPFGKTPEDIVGSTPDALLPPHEAAKLQNLVRRVFEAGTNLENEFTVLTASGDIRHRLVMADPIRDHENRVIYVSCLSKDITERFEREHQIEVVATTSAVLRAASTRQEMLPLLLDQMLKLLEAGGAMLGTLDAATGEIVLEQGSGFLEGATGLRLPPGKGVIAKVVAAGHPVLDNTLSTDADLGIPELITNNLAMLAVPLVAQDEVFGALCVTRARVMNDRDTRQMMAIADIAANALRRASLHEQTQMRLEHLMALRTIEQSISGSLDLRLVLRVIVEQATLHLKADAASVLLLKPYTLSLEFAAGRGFRSRDFERTSLHLGEGRAGRAAMGRTSGTSPTTRTPPAFARRRPKGRPARASCSGTAARWTSARSARCSTTSRWSTSSCARTRTRASTAHRRARRIGSVTTCASWRANSAASGTSTCSPTAPSSSPLARSRASGIPTWKPWRRAWRSSLRTDPP